ncbi:MAG: alpha/beta fold hydrolase [Promethearchaeota archaeon]
MGIIDIGGTDLYFSRYGSGIPFLLMHGGLGLDHSYFRPSLDPLGDFLELISYDHRNHGRSGHPPIENLTFEQLADDANELRKGLGFKKVGIIGHSAGGYAALHYAIRHPEYITYLILYDTVPVFDHMEEMMEIIQKKNPTPEIMEALNAPADPTPEGFGSQLTTLLGLYFYDYNEEMQEKARLSFKDMIFSPEPNIHQDKLLPTYDVTPYLKDIQTPTLILVGEDDFICPASQARRMHEAIPNSELHIFEKCGHLASLEAPEEFVSVIREWINKVEKK